MTRITLTRGALIGGAILLSGTVLLTACAGATSNSASASGARPLERGIANAPVPAAAGAQVNAGVAGAGSSASAQETAKLAQLSQSIIFTAEMTLRSGNALDSAKTAIRLATMAGGYVAGEQATAASPGKSGGLVTLTLKVPVPNYQGLLTQLSGLGKQLSLTREATDVTQRVADVNSLVSSQEAAITALQGLLKRAASVPDLLQVQQEISADESNLEALQSQQRALEHETSYATISMTLLSIQHPIRHKHHVVQHGFLAGLSAGWRALRHATVAVLTALGAALPFLIVVAILAGAGLLLRRRTRTDRSGSPEAG